MPYPVRENIDTENADELKFSVRKLMLIGMIMASMAGYINSAMLMEFGIPVSQMTGVASRLSEAMSHMNLDALLIPLSILIGFLIGAILSGLIIGRAQYKTSANYGHALLLNGGLLGSATLFSFYHSETSLFFSAVACGLQNALVASYRGQQLRTTHMTGTVTDIGVHIALKLKTRQPWPWQANLLLVLLGSFLVGGILGIFAFQSIPYWSMILPCIINILLGTLYLTNYYRQESLNG
ncbi:YoaK family protein [Thiomicrorhabdus xiamenensis]|uniref:DUF1275 domain-containing protein n=1 Tax=Thiomicrorhabdus xiamenensis TaxID=2739063 RepID=A0A7D4SZR3_9GAMM|nr:YoaK family protein [Thiomicrorhabdus xiamenensis]QKI90184.1 DUF1275 domain-containing protein [Thiomicrorhabdus xiamenensis]